MKALYLNGAGVYSTQELHSSAPAALRNWIWPSLPVLLLPCSMLPQLYPHLLPQLCLHLLPPLQLHLLLEPPHPHLCLLLVLGLPQLHLHLLLDLAPLHLLWLLSVILPLPKLLLLLFHTILLQTFPWLIYTLHLKTLRKGRKMICSNLQTRRRTPSCTIM